MQAPFLALIRKDILLEWRQKHTFFGVLLYIGCTVFATYMMNVNEQLEPAIWNALFWIIQLFTTVNSVAKSFLQEPPQRFRYYYTLVKPATFILAKIVYSVLLQLVMCLVSLFLFRLMLGNPVVQSGLFLLVALTGGISLSVVFTFLSAIAARAQQNSALMAILGFPIVIPVLMMLSKLAVKAVSPVYQPGWWSLLLVLLLLDVLVLVLGIILFPFIWQE